MSTVMDLASPDEAAVSREKKIVRTSVIGIAANVLLAVFKAVVGVMSRSIAIVMDAVNNLSDAAGSLITIVGTKLARREPDRKHPYGYGRIEYLSAMVISLIVLYAGITSFFRSIRRIIHPYEPEYSALSLIIVGAAVAVKILLGRYVKKVGREVNSGSLVNSGQDAVLDAAISASTLAAAAVFLIFHVSLEAWLAAGISLFIVRSGVGMLKDTLSQILGERIDPELSHSIKDTVRSFPGVQGAYDLVLNNYGPENWNGSIHIAVPSDYTAEQLDRLMREIQAGVYEKHRVILTGISIYSVDMKDAEVVRIRRQVHDIVHSSEHVKQMHGFYLDRSSRFMRFDLVISFHAKSRAAVYRKAVGDVQKAFPDYTLQVSLDTDFAEE